jgi:site-specific DNA-cytosine methylase
MYRRMILMKKVIMLVGAVLTLSACSEPDLTIGDAEIEENFAEAEFNSYIKDVSYEIKEKEKNGYMIDVIVNVSDKFENYENRERLGMMGHFYENYIEGDYIECGGPDCIVNGLVLKTKNNEYSLVKETLSLFPSLLTNGKDEYTWEQLKEENSKLTEVEEAEKAANEPKTNGTSNSLIYEYMKVAYDELTNYGDTYDPEVHDHMVAQMAAERFGITVEQASSIYIEYEMNQ